MNSSLLRRFLASLAALLVVLCTASQAQTVNNGGFDTPLVNTFLSSPSGSGWSFSGPGGISSGTWSGSGLGVVGTHAGQFAFLQWSGTGGSISQSITFPSAGSYILSYAVAGRDSGSGGTGNTTYTVGVSGGVLSTSGSTTSDQPFTPKSATLNIPSAGTYTLTFANTTGSGDEVFYVDSVAIAAPAAIGSISATYTSASVVAVTASNPTLTGGTATLSLGYAPVAGTNLTVVNNTGLSFISGAFSNLAQGQAVALSYGGLNYSFVANYYGGTGNDLVLQWANVRPLAWGNNSFGELGNNSTTQSNVPTTVLNSGVLTGKTVVSLAAGQLHSVALCSDGTVAAWGWNNYGQLGNNSIANSAVPVAVNAASGTSALYGKTVVSIAAGASHSVALCSDGTVVAWGWNNLGQLGNNSIADSAVPVAVNVAGGTSALYGKTVVAIAAGSNHSLALCSDGTVASWGGNYYGQLGNNSTTQSLVPVALNVASGTSALSGKTVVSIAAGQLHSMALCSDGTVAAWGYNGQGPLGNNSRTDSAVPVAVNVASGTSALSGKTVVAIAAGQAHSMALCSDGTVAAWGYNADGELGNNSTTYSAVPVAVNVDSGTSALSGKTVVSIAAGYEWSVALCSDGTVAAWGLNTNGELGNNSVNNSSVPVNTSALASGERFSLLGVGQSAIHALALVAEPLSPTATTGAASSITATGATLNGTVNASGASTTVTFQYGATTSYGQTATASQSPLSGSSATSVTAALTSLPPGMYHFRVVATNSGGTTNGSDATFVVTIANATAAYTSASVVAVTASNPTLTGGTATLSLGYAPVAGTNLTVVNNTGLGFISGTFSNLAQGRAVALSYGGVTYNFAANYYGGTGNDLVLQWANVRPLAWGNNANGQLGNNSTTQSNVPTAVLNSGVLAGKTVVSLATGAYHSVALCSDGTVAAWGLNTNGQLGNNSTTQSLVPAAVNVASGTSALFGKTVVSLVVGYDHSLAVCSDGTVAAWGNNISGQLGNNSTTTSSVPVAVNLASGTSALYGKTVVSLAAGASHSMALCSDGTLVAWGFNGNGQLGNNSTTQSLVPVAVNVASGTSALYGKTVVSLAAGLVHSMALCSDGTVAAWGSNGNGELGNNSTTDSPVPVVVNVASGTSALSGKTVVSLTAGLFHSVALCSDGTVAAWGWNFHGQLGNNSTTDSSVPVAVNVVSGTSVLYGKTVVSFATGYAHSVALCSDGTVAAWGYNAYGELGNNSMTTSLVPVVVNTSALASGERFSLIGSGLSAFHTLALVAVPPPTAPMATTGVASSITATGATFNGTVNANGSSTTVTFQYGATTSYGQTATASQSPLSGSSATSVSAALTSLPPGTYHFRVVATNSLGTTNGSDATFVVTIANATAAYTSASVVAVTASNPTLTGGTATLSLGYAPVAGTNLTVVNNTGLGFISGAFSNLAHGQAVALSYGGLYYSFVANYYGGTGNDLVLQWANVRPLAWGNDGSTTRNIVPTAVPTSGVLAGKTVVSLAAGQLYSMALCSDGTVAAWGYNISGQLGNNSTTQSDVPVAVDTSGVLSGKTVVAIAAGTMHSVALCSDGTVAAWGLNTNGQLGNNSTTNSLVPVAVDTSGVLSGKTVVAIAAGSYHSVALCSDGTVAAWGYNSTTNSLVPVAVDTSGVLAGKTVVSLAAGLYHSVALCSDGTVATWGGNQYGQLGSNTTNSLVPVAVVTSGVLSGKTVVSIAAGAYHSVALCSDGTVAAWGDNGYGQLGNNSTTESDVPVAVDTSGVLVGKTVVSIAAGSYHSVALCSDGTVAAWGYNVFGQLGSYSSTNSPAPVAVNTSALASGERFSLVGSGQSAYHTLALVAAPPPPKIAVEQPMGTGLTSGSSTISFGVMAAGSSTTAKTFTIKNLGISDLTGIVITANGTNAGEYTVSTTGMAATVASNASTTFTVTFTPAAAAVSGTRTAALHIASNDPNQNPFDIALSGTGLSQTYDTDADGLNDAAEFQLASLGFDWQTAQPALVAALTTNANTANLFTPAQVTASRQAGQNDVTGSPNTYSLYTQSQFQALSVGVPLLQMNGTTGQFKLTIGVQKSSDLVNFNAFPLTTPQTTVNAQGQLEIQFTVPDGTAFFRLQSH